MQHLFVGVEQAVAPVDGVGERPVPGLAPSWPAQVRGPPGEQLRGVVEGERPQPGRSELDTQRDAVDRRADPGDSGRRRRRQREVGVEGAHAVGEEQRARVRRDVAGIVGRDGQGPDPHDLLAVDPEGLPAGSEDGERRSGPDERLGDARDRFQQVLAVVEDEQHPAVGDEGSQGLQRRGAGPDGEAQRRGDRSRDTRHGSGFDRGQGHEEHAVRELRLGRVRHLRGQPRLAAPHRADHRDEPVRAEAPAHVGPLVRAADERRQPYRNRCRGRLARRHGSRRGSRRVERGVVGQHPPLGLAQLRPRLDPELVPQQQPGLPVGVQRGALPPAPVERDHPLRVQLLPVGLLGDERPDRRQRLLGSPGVEQRGDPHLAQREPQVLQAGADRTDPLVVEVGVGPAAPQRRRGVGHVERHLGAAGRQFRAGCRDRCLQPSRVHRIGIGDQPVAAGIGDEDGGPAPGGPLGLQHAAQAPHVGLEHRCRAVRGARSPDGFDEPRRGHLVVQLDEQGREHGGGAAASGCSVGVRGTDRQHAQVAEPHVPP